MNIHLVDIPCFIDMLLGKASLCDEQLDPCEPLVVTLVIKHWREKVQIELTQTRSFFATNTNC